MLDLPDILAAHRKWVRGEVGGKRANLSGANLSGANLSGANLRGAGLREADLSGANLSAANLRGANLSWANLSEADLSGANLSGADLRGANLSAANLRGADLSGADLREASLRGADLSGTVLDQRNRPADATDSLREAGIPIHGGIAYGWRTRHSQHVSRFTYGAGRHVAPALSTSANTDCHPGIYFGSRSWLLAKYPGVELVPCATWVSCVVAAGDKFRTKELWVFDEADKRWCDA